jgi:hypothetical protein
MNTNFNKSPIIAILAIFFLVLVSCEKEDFLEDPPGLIRSSVEVIDYDLNTLSEQELAYTLIAKAIGTKFQESPSFRKQFFKKITYTEGRATKDYFVLDFLDDDFDGVTGAEILSPKAGNNSNKISRIDVEAYLKSEAPNTVFKLPAFVESYFWAKEVIEEDMSIFTGLPFAVFPATSKTSSSNTFVGYGDAVDENKGIYGVEPQGEYKGYLPIHVKESENKVILNQDNYVYHGGLLASAFGGFWSQRGLNCFREAINGNTVSQDFLPPGLKLVDYTKLAAESRDCRTSKPGEGTFRVPPYVFPPPVWPPVNPPLNVMEICDNGIDDDDDGLIDDNDPDCQVPPSDEICDNGIDDDGDGLVDGDDPNCLTCPESAVYPRDCNQDFNQITGTKFTNINYYREVQALTLPGIIENVNLRFDMFFVNNIPGCTDDCPIGKDFQSTSNPMLIIFTDPEWAEFRRSRFDFNDDYESFYSPGLDNGNPGHFIAKAIPSGASSIPQGAIKIGDVGGWNWRPRGGPTFNFNLDAYIISTNWIPARIPYMNISSNEWYPTNYGNIVYMSVHEVDALTATLVEGTTTSSTNTSMVSVNLAAAIPKPFGLGGGSTENPGLSPTLGYDFTNSEVKTGSQMYTLSAARVYELGTFSLTYQDLSNDDQPVTNGWGVIQNNGPGTVSSFSYGWGWGNSNLPAFYYGWNGDVNTPFITALDMVDIIRIE